MQRLQLCASGVHFAIAEDLEACATVVSASITAEAKRRIRGFPGISPS
jgi:hypothetical protein